VLLRRGRIAAEPCPPRVAPTPGDGRSAAQVDAFMLCLFDTFALALLDEAPFHLSDHAQ